MCLRSMFPLLKERKINPNSRFGEKERVTVEVVGKVATIAVLRMLVVIIKKEQLLFANSISEYDKWQKIS